MIEHSNEQNPDEICANLRIYKIKESYEVVTCRKILPLYFLNHSFRVRMLVRECEVEGGFNDRKQRC
ncbi:hypothetical protein Hanom_Chr14g01320651 [Helianthus anomalus]